MAHTVIVGDGPGGLSAALFLARILSREQGSDYQDWDSPAK